MQTFLIGRDASNQIVLNDEKISRRHAQLTRLDNGQIMIKDLGSVNGTYVNGNKITESYLNGGDIVKCGPVFLNWSQYMNSGSPTGQQMNYAKAAAHHAFLSEQGSDSSATEYKLGDVFKYLTTRIFEIGTLFKTNWERTSSILVLNGVPVILTLIISIIIYSKFQFAGFYFSPTILALFLFAVCPFITVYLLSVNKKVQTDRVALASGIIGIIQFSSIFCYVLCAWTFFQHLSPDYGNYFAHRLDNHKGLDLFIITISIAAIIFLINLAIAFCIVIYKYFTSIGVDRSRSIYLVMITWGINLFFQILSAYVIFLIVKDSFGSFNF